MGSGIWNTWIFDIYSCKFFSVLQIKEESIKYTIPDLKHAFDVLDLYASDPNKRRELEERLRADKNYTYDLAAKFEQQGIF
jgi:hypothetical protein